jgi:SAM-dependent methyltransferase
VASALPSRYYDADAMRARVEAGEHREAIGGLWEEIGALQIAFLVRQGLRPQHRLLDLGCGAFRAGVKLLPYLDAGNYYGVDVSAELVQAGLERELAPAGLLERLPASNLELNDEFDVSAFGVDFDFGIAQSVFTHLPLHRLPECLAALGPFFRSGGLFFSTWFVGPHPSSAHPEHVQEHGVRTYCDRDLYHASVEEIVEAAEQPGWRPVWIGDWGHPRFQRMLASVRISAAL